MKKSYSNFDWLYTFKYKSMSIWFYVAIWQKSENKNPRNPFPHKWKLQSVWNSNIADALRLAQDSMNSKNFYAVNTSFDK